MTTQETIIDGLLADEEATMQKLRQKYAEAPDYAEREASLSCGSAQEILEQYRAEIGRNMSDSEARTADLLAQRARLA